MRIKNSQEINDSMFSTHRIHHLIKILRNLESWFLNNSKIYYIKLLKNEICRIFKYPKDSVNYFLTIFPLSEAIKFIESNEKQRPLTIRYNNLKKNLENIKKNLEKKGIKIFSLDKPLEIAGIISKNGAKIGNTSEFLAGYYTLQSIASLLPVLALNPTEGDRILDIAAAPGGKSTFISQLMNNKGILIANDKNKIRIKSLVSSVHRMGCTNCIITNIDGIMLPFIIRGFDKVLIDAPCTGTGIVSHDLNIKMKNISKKTFSSNFSSQKRLLLAAIDSCNERSTSGGIIIYSTCSILVEENEFVIQYAVQNRNVRIIDTGLNIGMPGFKKFKDTVFDKNMENCRRFFPHVHNTDGFFVCKLKKLSV